MYVPHASTRAHFFTYVRTRQRIRAPLGGKQNRLPDFPDNESWYLHVGSRVTFKLFFIGFDPFKIQTQLTAFTWAERYVEFGRE